MPDDFSEPGLPEAPVLPPLDLSGAGIQISVIMPLHDYRFAARFLDTWGKHQTCGAGSYEILVIGGGEHLRWEARIRRHLRPQDRWIHCPGVRLLRYAEGVRQARGKVLLFTEDHCVAHRGCLRAVFETFHHTSTTGVILRCGHINHSPLSEMEEAHEKFWDGHHAWNQFRLRGTALRRDVYGRPVA